MGSQQFQGVGLFVKSKYSLGACVNQTLFNETHLDQQSSLRRIADILSA
jgi:hypothetical protein